MVSLFLYKTYVYKKEEEHANALVNRRTSSLCSELFSISLPLSVPKERYESSSCNRRIFLARPTLSKLTLSFKRHRAIGGAKRKKTSGGLAKHRLRSVARELQVARRRLSRLPRTFSTSSPRAFRLFPVLLLRLFSFFSPFSLSHSLSLSFYLSFSLILALSSIFLAYGLELQHHCRFLWHSSPRSVLTSSSSEAVDTRIRLARVWHPKFVLRWRQSWRIRECISVHARWYTPHSRGSIHVDCRSFLWSLSRWWRYIYIYIHTYIAARNEDESRSIRGNNSNAR